MGRNQLLLIPVSSPELDAGEAAAIRAIQPGGFLLEPSAVTDGAQARSLTDALRDLTELEPLICLRSGDRCWPAGVIDPLPPSPRQLVDHGDAKRIMTAGWIAGRLLRMLGVNLHLAPDLGIGAWGRDDQEVINHAGTFNRYQRKQGLLGGGLPFPGGDASTGLDLDTLLRASLLPFTALMPELDAILLSNAVFAKLDAGTPAAVSQRVVTGLLRDQLGYSRIVLAEGHDAAPVRAGADLVIVPGASEAPAVLASLAGLGGYTVADAVDRVEHARRRMHKPTKFSSRNLDRLRDDAAALQALL